MATEISATEPAWIPNTTIMDMPNEILLEIFISIDSESSKTLWSLCLICMQFRSIVEKYCEPEYNVRGRLIEEPFTLMERIKVQPNLRNIIRVARMENSSAAYMEYTEEELHAFAFSFGLEAFHAAYCAEWDDLLACSEDGPTWLTTLLPRIEIIELTTTTADRRPSLFWTPSLIGLLNDPETGNVLQSHGFQHLRSLTLLYPPYNTDNPNHPRVYHDLYIGVLKLRNLKTLKLDNVMFCHEGWSESFQKLSSVTELHIQIYQEGFMCLGDSKEWDTFIGLEKLVLQVEFPFIRYEEGYYVAPQYISCLRSQAHSLQDLQLYSNEQYCTSDGTLAEIKSHCPRQRDLRHFKRLKSLALTDMSLMGVSTDGPAHWHQSSNDTLNHLANMFPASLETFTHLVWDGPSAFASIVPASQQMLRSWGNIWKAARQEQFPSLKKVMLQKYGLSGVSDERVIIWETKA